MILLLSTTNSPGDHGNDFKTSLLLWHAARRRHPDRWVRQHCLTQTSRLQIAERKTEHRVGGGGRPGLRGHSRLLGREYRGADGSGREARREDLQTLPECAEVQGLPRHARQGREEHRRRDRRLSRPCARQRGQLGNGARQARLLREAAHAHGVGSAAAYAQRGEVWRRHADGQPGLLERGRARVLRDDLVRRHRQRHRGSCLDQSPLGLLAARAGGRS